MQYDNPITISDIGIVDFILFFVIKVIAVINNKYDEINPKFIFKYLNPDEIIVTPKNAVNSKKIFALLHLWFVAFIKIYVAEYIIGKFDITEFANSYKKVETLVDIMFISSIFYYNSLNIISHLANNVTIRHYYLKRFLKSSYK